MGDCEHEFEDDFMLEEGVYYPIKVCKHCGVWG